MNSLPRSSPPALWIYISHGQIYASPNPSKEFWMHQSISRTSAPYTYIHAISEVTDTKFSTGTPTKSGTTSRRLASTWKLRDTQLSVLKRKGYEEFHPLVYNIVMFLKYVSPEVRDDVRQWGRAVQWCNDHHRVNFRKECVATVRTVEKGRS